MFVSRWSWDGRAKKREDDPDLGLPTMTTTLDPRRQRLLGGTLHRPAQAPASTVRTRRRGRHCRKLSHPPSHAGGTRRAGFATGPSARYSNSLQVDVRLIDTAFQNAGIAGSLRDALEQLDGPILRISPRRALSCNTECGRMLLCGCTHRELIGLLQAPAGIGASQAPSPGTRKSPPAALQLCPPCPKAVLQRSARERHHTFAIGRRRAG